MDSFDFGGGSNYDLFGGDTPDYGSSFDFGMGGGGSDLMSQFDMGFSPQLQDPTAGMGMGSLYGGAGGAPFSAPGGAGVGGGGTGLMGQPGGFLNALTSPQSLLGLGGGLAGIIGQLTGRGVQGTTTPKIPTAAMAQLNQSNQALQPFALGQTPLQMQQAQMLQALSQGQIPQGYADLVARAYDPAYQQAATRAIEGARQAGFYDNPLSSPVGGSIMGPAAAQQASAAGNQSQALLNAARQQTGSQQSAPLGPQIGQAIGAGLQGVGQGIGQQQAQQQQSNQMNSFLQALQRGNTGLSYQPNY